MNAFGIAVPLSLAGALVLTGLPARAEPGNWYYCEPMRGYYPYVPTCPAGWHIVSPDKDPHGKIRAPAAPPADADQPKYENPKLAVPLEKDASIYDSLVGQSGTINDLLALIKLNNYRCDSISGLAPMISSVGYSLDCNDYAYFYEISGQGGHWIVKIK